MEKKVIYIDKPLCPLLYIGANHNLPPEEGIVLTANLYRHAYLFQTCALAS